MKQLLLGSVLGRYALSFRDTFDILHTAYFNPENIGTLANDQLASNLVTKLCQPNKTFIDVGAHIGSIISGVMDHDSSIKIIAIEAMPDKIRNLRRKFPSVEFHDCAVGETPGDVSFFVNKKLSGYSSLIKPEDNNRGEVSEIRVPLKKVDDLITSKDVDVIKIDVEGVELGVLRGAVNLLKNLRPVIMFESGPQSNDDLGYTKEAMHQFLTANDYVVLIPIRIAHNDPGLSENQFVEAHLYPRRTTNYFAVPKERRDEIRERVRSILKLSK
ncbi:MAG: FkbM family methyltransferase [Methyloglobulus sp.]|nr:FkbM family methyltransferase [Methyloglobulus sp.]